MPVHGGKTHDHVRISQFLSKELDRGVRKAPDHLDMLWLKGEVISNQVGRLEAIEFIERVIGRVENPAHYSKSTIRYIVKLSTPLAVGSLER